MIYALVTFHVQPSKVDEFESLHRALARFISGQPARSRMTTPLVSTARACDFRPPNKLSMFAFCSLY
jgi:hypothetical protein